MSDKFMAEDDRTIGQLQLDLAIVKEQLRGTQTALELSEKALNVRLEHMNEFRGALKDQLDSVKEINWPLIFSGLALLGSAYFAGIVPLQQKLDAIEKYGSHSADRRLAVVEYRLKIGERERESR